MATVTVTTTPVELDDGSHATISIGNTGAPGSPTAVVTIGSRVERFEQGFSRRLTTGGVAVSAVTAFGSTTLAVDTTGVSPTPGQIDESELAAAIAELALGDAALLDVGTGSGTVAAGNDSRIVGAAQKSANLSDLGSAGTARTNLGLSAAATAAVGTGAGTLAAGDDSRIVGAAQKSANLSDLASPSTARTNLGLAAGATAAIGTGAGTVAAGDDSRITGAAQKSANLSDVGSASTARTNLGAEAAGAAAAVAATLGTSATRNVGTATGTVAAGDDVRIPVPAVLDDFARADSSSSMGTATTGQAWTVSGGTWGISGGKGYVVSAALNTIATVPFVSADFDMQVTVAGSAANNQGFAFRATSNINGYVLNFKDSGVFKIHKFVSGVQTQLGASTVPGAIAGDVIRLKAVGSTFTVYRNGQQVLQVTDGTFTTQTTHGLYMFQAATAASKSWAGFSISAAGAPLVVYPDGTRAAVISRPRPGIDVRNYGLVADGATNDGPAFLRALSAAKNSSSTMPFSLSSDPTGNVTIYLPAGDHVITDIGGLLGQEAMSSKVTGLRFVGEGAGISRVIFKPTSAGDLCTNDYWLNLQFEGISFHAATAGCTFMHSSTTHNAQRYQFINCGWTNWKYVFYLEGSNNNSEFCFVNCHNSSMEAAGAFLRIPSTGADQFVNYWFFGCTHWSTSAPFIDADKGGQFHIYGLDASAFGSGLASPAYLFNLRGATHAQGVCNMSVRGLRVEAMSANAGLLLSEWPSGNVTMENVDWSSQIGSYTYGDIININTGNDNGSGYAFRDSYLAGGVKVVYYGNANQKTHKIVFENCQWAQKTSPSDVVTYDASSAGADKTKPAVVFTRCRGVVATNVHNSTGVATWDATIGFQGESLQPLQLRTLSVRGYSGMTSASDVLTFVLPVGALITGVRVLSPAGAVAEADGGSWVLATTDGSPVTVATATVAGSMADGFDVTADLSVPFECSTSAKAKLTITPSSVSTANPKALFLVKGYW